MLRLVSEDKEEVSALRDRAAAAAETSAQSSSVLREMRAEVKALKKTAAPGAAAAAATGRTTKEKREGTGAEDSAMVEETLAKFGFPTLAQLSAKTGGAMISTATKTDSVLPLFKDTVRTIGKPIGAASRMNCVDAGANLGSFTDQLLQGDLCKQIFLFEADDRNIQSLKDRFPKQMQSKKVDLFEGAVAHYTGRGVFQWEETSRSKYANAHGFLFPADNMLTNMDGWHSKDVPVMSIDDRAPLDVPLIGVKLDIQGGEWSALLGLLKHLEKGNVAVLTLEMFDPGPKGAIICEVLTRYDFVCEHTATNKVENAWGSVTDRVKSDRVIQPMGAPRGCFDFLSYMADEDLWTDFVCTQRELKAPFLP